MKRWIPRIITILVVGAGVAFLAIKQPWAKGDTPVTFSTVTVSKGNIAAQVTANGTLSAHTTVQVGAQVTGRVVELHADFNDPVKKGQVIAKLDPTIYKSNVDQARANLDQAVANVDKAVVAEMDGKRQYLRQIKMREQQLIADLTVEQAEVTYKEAVAATVNMKAQVEQNKAQLDQAVANLEYCTIYSPIDGIILTRTYDIGQTVQSSFSAPTLFTIAADLSQMQIDTSVAESDVGRLQDGMKATFTVDAFPGKPFEGKVRQVRNSPTTTNGVVTYDAVIDVDNDKHLLRPGMTANITFELDKVSDVVKIPNAALRFKPTREQMMALWEKFGGGHHGSGHHGGGNGGSGAGSGGSGGGAGGMGGEWAMGSGSGNGPNRFGDKKPIWKLVDGRPKMVLIKPGLSDGSSTQMLEGDIEAGDQLVTEVNGLVVGPSSSTSRRLGPF
jgi:HlyD family secretion protein